MSSVQKFPWLSLYRLGYCLACRDGPCVALATCGGLTYTTSLARDYVTRVQTFCTACILLLRSLALFSPIGYCRIFQPLAVSLVNFVGS